MKVHPANGKIPKIAHPFGRRPIPQRFGIQAFGKSARELFRWNFRIARHDTIFDVG
jgi:hypothetical protein